MSTIVVMATILVTIVPFLDGCHNIYRDSHYCGDYISRKIEARLGICQKIYRTEFSGEKILHTENA